MRFLSEDDRRCRNRALLASVVSTKFKAKREPSAQELTEPSLKVLVKAALEIGVYLGAIYQSLGLHPAEGKTAVDDLVARGMVKVHRLVRRGRGAQPRVLEVLSRGIAELATRGIAPAAKKSKGSFKHEVYARCIEKHVKGAGGRFAFEKTLGGKTFDGVEEGTDGRLIGYEVVLSGSVKWNAEQALKAASVKGVEQVILAFGESKLMKSVEAELKAQDSLGLFRGKIVLTMVSEYVQV